MRPISLLRAVGKCSFHTSSRDFSLRQETITENHNPSKYREHVGYPDSTDAHNTTLEFEREQGKGWSKEREGGNNIFF